MKEAEGKGKDQQGEDSKSCRTHTGPFQLLQTSTSPSQPSPADTVPPHIVPATHTGSSPIGPPQTVPPHTVLDTHTGLSPIGPSNMRVKKYSLKSPRAKRFRKAGTVRLNDSPSKEQTTNSPPTEEVLSTPPIAKTLFDTLVIVTSDSTIVVTAPIAAIVSLIWRIKRLPHMRKVPVKFSDYFHFMCIRAT
ncbi:hypothetical protein MRB53_028603 [Persea americana]|uniref:Uncharacterized protein n=1 Tax=Persea americana TaxID=3435 RepID=A0ACC2KG06_PERAE|nr:hypothetical protein MRB53_028603 [Persea americana]